MKDSRQVVLLDLDDILPNRFQPRIKFDEKAIVELSESIKEHGVIQPIIVRKISDKYEIIAGERRYKASVMAGKKNIPAIIVDLNDKDSSEIALIENVQRQDLTPIEEAISYRKILDMGYLTQEALATKLGVAQSTIANKLRLLNLDDDVQEALLDGKISERHARSLLKLSKSSMQKDMLKRIIDERLTVRKTDEEINNMIKNNEPSVFDSIEKNDITSFENNNNTEVINTENNPFIVNENVTVPEVNKNVEFLDFEFEEINPSAADREINGEPSVQEEEAIPTNPIIEDNEPVISTNPIVEDSLNNFSVQSEFDNGKKSTENINPVINQPIFEQQQVDNEPVSMQNDNLNVVEPTLVNENYNQQTLENVVPQPAPKSRFFTMVSPNFDDEQDEPSVSENSSNVFTTPISEEPNNNISSNNVEIPTSNIFDSSPIFSAPVVEQTQQNINEEEHSEELIKPIEAETLIMEEEPKSNSYTSIPEVSIPPVTQVAEEVPQSPVLRDVISKMRRTADEIEAMGFDIDTEEYDFDDIYQVIFKIKK